MGFSYIDPILIWGIECPNYAIVDEQQLEKYNVNWYLDSTYEGNAYYGMEVQLNEDSIVIPSEIKDTLSRFQTTFRFKQKPRVYVVLSGEIETFRKYYNAPEYILDKQGIPTLNNYYITYNGEPLTEEMWDDREFLSAIKDDILDTTTDCSWATVKRVDTNKIEITQDLSQE